ncbi:hypothetical protein [Coxiella burnetii]|uniref:hypothetical protein n=1 Tax=Coxiella burnetii TaxID=777 RepID=UPI0000183B45|nr:hypothetical protein [Coxiella burnetii]ABX78939.1 hypothetical protein COXBURSA331_A2006 [Coxiella burnetii RSA 331]ARK28002.1 hypothetical protein BMW92_09040 [Coxiella burnetii]ATN75090.1 hypothetical protein AYM90_09000 [Coxiella burnetii]ATN76998.1 hypothetical protein AYM94_09015 [Coxiella burnetii]ATN78915.1 hypothetical protein AYM93_09010 [Coxiella burnetii]
MSRQPTNSQQDIEPPNVASDRTVASTAAVEKKIGYPLSCKILFWLTWAILLSLAMPLVGEAFSLALLSK